MSVMWHALFRCEFKINHEEWIKSVKPKLGSNASEDVLAAIKTSYDDMKALYKVRTEMRIALQSLLKVSTIYCCVPWNECMQLCMFCSNSNKFGL